MLIGGGTRLRPSASLAGLVVLSTAATVGCGGGSRSDVASTAVLDAGPLAAPPLPSPNAVLPDGTDHVFAWRETFLGDKDWQDNDDPNAWKTLGYDIDGLGSGPNVGVTCHPVPGPIQAVSPGDGIDGIDNSWGANVMPIVLGLTSDAASKTAGSMAEPVFSRLITIARLGSGPSYFPLRAALYDTGAIPSAPKWDGADVWPIQYESVLNGDINAARIVLPYSYVTGRTWVSGSWAAITFGIQISGYSLAMTIHNAILSMDLAADSASATHGIVAGVLDTQELVTALRTLVGKISPSLCAGPTLDSILAQLTQASDIMKDGTQDPSRPCNGISIGIGFTASEAKLGAVLPPAQKGTDPCAGLVDAGGGG